MIQSMICSKKGIGVGQVFVFIIAAIAFSLIMIFGYRAISGFLESGEKVQFVQFQTDLENSIKKIYTEFNAVRVETYHLPGKYSRICFVDLDYIPNDSDSEIDSLCQENPAACTAWESLKGLTEDRYSKYDENVFLTPTSIAKIKVYRLSIVDNSGNKIGYLCQEISKGTFSLVLEGRGDRTEISEPE